MVYPSYTDQAYCSASCAKIAALVERFAADHKHYTAPAFNETELRIQFLNPFFEALDWDMAKVKGLRARKPDVDMIRLQAIGG